MKKRPQATINTILRYAEHILGELPHELINHASPRDQLSCKDVVGTAFAFLLVGAGINPFDFKSKDENKDYLRNGHSHASSMRVFHFYSSTRKDKEKILADLKELLLK
ncbi:MAG: hypothetical protein RLZZ517_288 [Candidatus Parcubacteria bacterium]|jgi:hypothetical protein